MLEKTIKFSLNNVLFTLILGVLILIGGYISYTRIPIDAFPDVSPNLVQVFTETEGLAPEEIEKYITYPVEASMTGLPKLKKIRSVSNFGLSVVNIYFEDSMDIYLARQLVNERVQEARENIPDGFGDPEMGPISTGMGLILFYYLDDETNSRSLEELRSIQDWIIKFHLQTVPGVTEVLGIGGYEKQFHVVINPNALVKYDITVPEIIEKIKLNNLNVGAQFIEQNSEEYVIRSLGLATNINDLSVIVLKSIDGVPVFLKDVAEIKTGGAIRRGLQTRNGIEEVVSGQVIKLFGTNSSYVIENVENKLAEINEILPEGVKIIPYYDQKSLVEACINTIMNALKTGIFLVVIILFIFMGGIRPSLIVVFSIPFSVLFSFILMKYFSISANLMSLGGIAVAIGMMVDGTIVMVEHVDRLLRYSDTDEPRKKIISRACKEVARPIIFSIMIIIIVFVPLFTLQGVEGKTFRPLAYTVSLAMFGSLIFALFFAPTLSYLFMRKPKSRQKLDHHDHIVEHILLKFYKPVVTFFVRNRKFSLFIGSAILITGVFIFPRLGSEFTPKLNEGTMVARLTMAPSISLEESKRLTMIVERRIMQIDEVEQVISRIGRGEVGAHTDPINSAEMYVTFKDKSISEKYTPDQLEEKLRHNIGNVPGVFMNFTQPIAMTIDELLEGVRAELAIKLFGDDLEILKSKADEIAEVVSLVEGAEDVQVDQVSGTPQILIKIDREALSRYGLNISDMQEVIRAAVGGEKSSQIFEGIRRYDVLVRFAPEYRNSPEAIKQILIQASSGINVPISQLATIETIIGPRQITREDNQRFITIQCNVSGRDIGSFVKDAQKKITSNVDLPSGYLVTWGGQFRLQQEANKRLGFVIPITLLIVFILIFSSFNSLKNALLILLNIPLALVGGMFALWVSGQNLSVPATVGFIALFGIALENGLVLVGCFNQLLEEGLSIEEASIKGACLRLRAVLMTAFTTLLGLIPILFSHSTGSEVQRPLATVVLGGLATSTMLTLLLLPSFYKWFSVKPEKS